MSCSEVLLPRPLAGGCRWAASPAMNSRPRRYSDGDDVVDLPRAHVLDANVDIGVADRGPHPRHHRLLRQLVRCEPVPHEDRAPLRPRLDARPDADDVVAPGVADDEQRARAVLRVLREVGLDPHGDRVAEARVALVGEVARASDDRLGAVAADRVPRDDVELGAAAGLDSGGDPVGVLLDRDDLVMEPDVGAELARPVEQDRLEEVLAEVRDRARARSAVVADAIVAAAPRHHPRQLPAGERGCEHLLAHQVVGQRARHHPVLDPEVAADLDRTLVGDVRPRRDRGRVLGHREGGDAGPGEEGGRGEAGGAGSHDQDVGGDGLRHDAPGASLVI